MLCERQKRNQSKSFTHRNTSEYGAEKNHVFGESKSSIMYAANLQQKFPIPLISHVWPEPDNQIKADSKTVGIEI